MEYGDHKLNTVVGDSIILVLYKPTLIFFSSSFVYICVLNVCVIAGECKNGRLICSSGFCSIIWGVCGGGSDRQL